MTPTIAPNRKRIADTSLKTGMPLWCLKLAKSLSLSSMVWYCIGYCKKARHLDIVHSFFKLTNRAISSESNHTPGRERCIELSRSSIAREIDGQFMRMHRRMTYPLSKPIKFRAPDVRPHRFVVRPSASACPDEVGEIAYPSTGSSTTPVVARPQAHE